MKTQTELSKSKPLNLTTYQEQKEKRKSSIVAQVIISESELAKVLITYDASYEEKHPEAFKSLLNSLGMDTDKFIQRQDTIRHRNRMNEVVICSRWVGEERQDFEWIDSGYASREAKDKYSGSKILEDLYRERSCTEGIQEYLEARDKYAIVDTSVWE